MSDKNKLDDEIEQELEDRLEDGESTTEGEDDFTVKVHREDYTVKRRFYDKDKALETADSLRLDKENIVEDNIEHEFVTLDEDEDDVDWDKLVDGGLSFDPPISNAAQKKIEETSNLADELAAESARVGNELDKTMTMSSKTKIDYPKIEPKTTDPEPSETSDLGSDDVEIEVNDLGEIDVDPGEPVEAPDEIEEAIIDELVDDEEIVDEEPEIFEEKKDVKTGGSAKKIVVLVVILAVAAGLYFFFAGPSGETASTPVVQKKEAVIKPVTQPDKQVAAPAPKAPVEIPVPEKVAEKETPVKLDVTPAPIEPEVKIPEVTKHYPYTIHISSYKSGEKANSEVSRIRKKGYNAFSASIEIPGKGAWHRIYAGYFETYTEATAATRALKSKLREDAIVAKTFFGVQIGPVAEKKNLVELEGHLRAKGHSVYYISVGDDEKYTRLISGAFKKKADVKNLYDKLVKDGFDAAIVKR